MHGLGDGAYWLITYAWDLLLYVIYMLIFILFGSGIGLNIFRKNSYAVQVRRPAAPRGPPGPPAAAPCARRPRLAAGALPSAPRRQGDHRRRPLTPCLPPLLPPTRSPSTLSLATT
jgi:hypothetical protein